MRSFSRPHVLAVAAGFVVLAAVSRFWLAPRLLILPADYQSDVHYGATIKSRDSAEAAWIEGEAGAQRSDRTLSSTGGISLIQGSMLWTNAAGEVIYDSSGVFGVDRVTRQLVSGYGDRERKGYFLFPPHLGQDAYVLWDPDYVGPRTARFTAVASVQGLEVYRFEVLTQVDESDVLAYLPDVPERYQAISSGHVTLWIEPVSGLVVDFQEQGSNYLKDPRTGQRVADVFQWTAHLTPEIRAAWLSQAVALRARILAAELWGPLALLSAAALLFFLSLVAKGLARGRLA